MSKIRVIFVEYVFFFKTVSTLNQIYSLIKNIPISVFGYFIIHKLNIQKMGKNKKNRGNFFKTHFEYCEFFVL